MKNKSFYFYEATGPVRFNMTNDYMFRAVLQKNEKVLRGLICALLHLAPEEITSVEITNPIQLGKDIDAKECHLDIAVNLNNSAHLNLEMQVRNEGNWPERSLSYLCRSFDSLTKGQDYLDIPAVMHFSFLDFTLFPDEAEFYANYQMLNVKTHRKYSDKFSLFVIDLTQIHLATEEDKAYQLDYWAELFKATTWEDIKMLAEKNELFEEAADTIYMLSAEEDIRLRCEAREEYERMERFKAKMAERREAEHAKKVAEFNKKEAEFRKTEEEFKKNEAEYKKNEAEYKKNEAEYKKNEAEYKKNEAEYKEKLARQESILAEKDIEIQRLKEALAGKQ